MAKAAGDTSGKRTPERKTRPKSPARKKEQQQQQNAHTQQGKNAMEEPTPGNIQEEGFIDAFYQPRSFSALVLLVVMVIFLTIIRESDFITWMDSNTSPAEVGSTNMTECEDLCKGCETDCHQACGDAARVKAGIVLAACSFLLYCGIQLRDSHLLRPHPAVWRVAHGAGLLYFLLLVYLLCQDYQGVINFLKLFDLRSGTYETEKSYGEDCRLYAPELEDPWINLKHQVYDRFVIAHFLGWTLKALILRDWGLMWIASVLFEVLEISFQHMWPNFNECYWDHLILDIFGCNLGGMIFGMYLVEYLGTHQFDWTGNRIDSIKGSFGKMRRVALQFTPHHFETYRWQVFSTWRRAVIGVSVLFILLLGELNAFFLKSTFKIPIDSDINLYRLSFWVLMTYMSIFEFHHFADGKSRRVGVNSWLAGSLVSLETILVIKHIHGESLFSWEEIIPQQYILIGWQATFVLVMITVVTKLLRKMILWWGGASEVIPPMAEDAPVQGTKSRSVSFDSIDPMLRGYVRAGIFLNQVFQLLTYAIPMPLIIVLIIDCLRTIGHPTPPPHDDQWPNFLLGNLTIFG